MSDTKDKIKSGIDKTKDAAGAVLGKAKEAATSSGDAMKKGGEKLKNSGKWRSK